MRPLLLAFLVLSLGITGFAVFNYSGGSVSLDIVEVSTDKETYHSAGLMNFTLFIQSNSDVEDVTVSINGVRGRVSQQKTVDLNTGLNEVSFHHVLPSCNRCSGISPGEYELVTIVEYKGVEINKSKTINIQQ